MGFILPPSSLAAKTAVIAGELGEQGRRFFAEHGWVVVRGAVAAGRAVELLEALQRAVSPAALAASAGRVVELPQASRLSPALDSHVHDPRMARLLAEALGASRLQLLQDTALIKAPLVGGRVEWHQDRTYMGYLDQPRAATLRLALTDETLESGCLRVLDGSHLWGYETPLPALQAATVEDALSALPDALRARAVGAEIELELQPGDATIHHCLTFHSSSENRTARTRATLVLRAFDASCRCRPDRVPAGAARHFPVDARGGLSESAFPLIYDAAR